METLVMKFIVHFTDATAKQMESLEVHDYEKHNVPIHEE
jgi:hypothetical protein